MKKKMINMLLATMLIVALVLPMSVSASLFTDISGQKCEEAVNRLNALGIVNGRTEELFAPAANVTRAEMAAITNRMMGVKDPTVAEDIFDDVTPAHWAYKEITMAYRLGVINGIDAHTFAPDEYVTNAQMIKMIVSTLGYGVVAQSMGGYPAGYYAKAAELGILNGISGEWDKAATRSDMAIAVYNSIEVDLFQKTSFGGSKEEYAINEGKTLLSEYLNIGIEEGVITSAYFAQTNADSDLTLNPDEVVLNGVVYKAGTTDAKSRVGEKVKAYYDKSGDDEVLTLIDVQPKAAVKTLTINARDLLADECSKSKVVYEKSEGKNATASISDGAVIILNGKEKADWTKSDIAPVTGEIKLVMNDGVSANMIIVSDIQNYVVTSKDVNAKKVYFTNVNGETSKELDAADTSIRSEYIDVSTGAEFTLNDVKKWDILSIIESEDGKVIRVLRSTEVATGKISEISGDKIKVGDKEYYIAPSLKYNSALKQPEISMSATYHIDALGDIAAVDTTSTTDFVYGYLVSAANKKGIGGNAQFKIFTADGLMKIFDAADNITVNGNVYKASNVLENLPRKGVFKATQEYNAAKQIKSIYEPAETEYAQLIKYRTNEDLSKVTEIMTATNVINKADDYAGADGFNLVFELDKNRRVLQPYFADSSQTVGLESDVTSKIVRSADGCSFVGSSVSMFASKFLMRSSTKIFQIPPAGSPDKDYKIRNSSTLSHGDTGEKYTNMSLYDISETYVVGAMVWDQSHDEKVKKAEYSMELKPPTALITSVAKSVDNDGVACYNYKMITWDGKEITAKAEADFEVGYRYAVTDLASDPYAYRFNVDENGNQVSSKDKSGAIISPSMLNVGDIIQYTLDTNGYFTIASVLFRAKTPGMYEIAVLEGRIILSSVTSNYNGGNLVCNGTVSFLDDEAIVASTYTADAKGNRAQKVTRIFPATGNMYMIDMKKNTVKPMAVSEITPGDTFVTLWMTNSQMMFLVYRY